jgi:HEAT repeats
VSRDLRALSSCGVPPCADRASLVPVELPAEDRARTTAVAPIDGVPAPAEDDLGRADETSAWSAATRLAQALHSADELLWGLRHHDWHVRHQSVDRLIARGQRDGRTLPALLEAAVRDRAGEVRRAVVMRLSDLDPAAVLPVLQAAAHDCDRSVRWAARLALFQKGFGSDPGVFDCREGGDGWCEIIDGPRLAGDD